VGKVPAAARAARLVGREEDAEHHDLDRHQRLQGQHEREAAHRPRVRPQARQPVRGQAAHQRVGHHERRACARSQGQGRVPFLLSHSTFSACTVLDLSKRQTARHERRACTRSPDCCTARLLACTVFESLQQADCAQARSTSAGERAWCTQDLRAVCLLDISNAWVLQRSLCFRALAARHSSKRIGRPRARAPGQWRRAPASVCAAW